MGLTLTGKILHSHLVGGRLVQGEPIAIAIDQTLTQDATGPLAYLQFEALGIPRVRTKRSVSYVDHGVLQTGLESADDHAYLQSVAAKHGIVFSPPGHGICHQVHLERFSAPGQTLLGSDSHTPTCGGAGMLAIGAGSLDVAAAMGGSPYHLPMPRLVGVRLTGRLPAWVTSKDVIFELLRRLTTRGGVGTILEYFGPGVKTLSVPERATIANMGAELGAVTSLFPSDGQTQRFLAMQKRAAAYVPLAADPGAGYDEVLDIALDKLEPLIACPSSPDNVKPIRSLVGLKIHQVLIGSCTNSSLKDLWSVAAILRGRTVAPWVSLGVAPGSRQVLANLARSGALADLIAAGARILESACGPCIGMGQAPATDAVSVRSFNRNFPGRSGTPNDHVYLASPEACAAFALAGQIVDLRTLRPPQPFTWPKAAPIDDAWLQPPHEDPRLVEIVRGPHIAPLPRPEPPGDALRAPVLLKVGDHVTTDHILPAGPHTLPLRSNLLMIAEHAFEYVDPHFGQRAKAAKAGIVVGGHNYGQGSSREHAALALRHLGVRAVLAKDFARAHRATLIYAGILPLEFERAEDYEAVAQDNALEIPDLRKLLAGDGGHAVVRNLATHRAFPARLEADRRERDILLAGGLLNATKARLEGFS